MPASLGTQPYVPSERRQHVFSSGQEYAPSEPHGTVAQPLATNITKSIIRIFALLWLFLLFMWGQPFTYEYHTYTSIGGTIHMYTQTCDREIVETIWVRADTQCTKKSILIRPV